MFDIAMRITFGLVAIAFSGLLVFLWVVSGVPTTVEGWVSCIVVNAMLLLCIVPSAGMALESWD